MWIIPVLLLITETPTLDAHLQVRPRAEKSFAGNINGVAGNPNWRISQRTRGMLGLSLGDVSSRLVLQDVRDWASETGSAADFTADGLDAHEGWLQYGKETFVRVGRQEIGFDEERLLGATNWAQQGRSFDGVRLTWSAPGSMLLTAFASRVPDGGLHDMFVAHAATDIGSVHLSVPVFWQDNRSVPEGDRGARGTDEWYRATAGVYAANNGGDLAWRVEGYGQAGKNVGAFMGGGRVGYKLHALATPTLWVDYLSGDSDHTDERLGAFDTMFGTNHKFYGHFDQIATFPATTSNGGLVDLCIKNTSEIGPGKLNLEGHYFLFATKDSKDREGPLGVEGDLIYTASIAKGLTLEVGAALFRELGDYATGRDLHDWYYVQLDAQL